MKFKMHKTAKVLLIAGSFWYLGEGMFAPLFALFAGKVGGDVFDIVWATVAYLVVKGVLVMFVGRLSDRKVTKERFMLLGYILNTIFTFSYLLVSKPVHLIIVEIGMGVAVSLTIPTWDALLSRYDVDEENSGFMWGLVSGQANLSNALAIVIGGAILKYTSYEILFVSTGIVQLLGTIYLWHGLKDDLKA